MIVFLKYWHYITIAGLVALLGYQKIQTDSKYHSLELKYNDVKIKALEDTVQLQKSTVEYQAALFNDNFKLLDGLRNDIQKN